MTEQEILDQIEYTASTMNIACHNIVAAKKALNVCELELIDLKIQHDRLLEQLEAFRNTTTDVVQEIWDIDLERLRNAYPELCEWARERDKQKEKP